MGVLVVVFVFFLLVFFVVIILFVLIVEVLIVLLSDCKGISCKKVLVILILLIGVLIVLCMMLFGMVELLINFVSYGGVDKSLFDIVYDVFYDMILFFNGLMVCLFVMYCWKKVNFFEELS